VSDFNPLYEAMAAVLCGFDVVGLNQIFGGLADEWLGQHSSGDQTCPSQHQLNEISQKPIII
jgi:hypothetical protein